MSFKKSMNAIAKVFSPDRDTLEDSHASSTRRCEVGHLLDPNWETCPYCANARTTAVERTEAPQASYEAAGGERRTRTDSSPAAAPSGRATRIAGGEGPAAAPPQRDTRKIAGVLVTFTWQPEGQLFEIREGKNYIGAGDVESEGGYAPCDVRITTDPMMSREHALLLVRRGHDGRLRYEVHDLKSSNGTFVGDEMVPLQGKELSSISAQIKTGSTAWQFLRIDSGPETPAPQPVRTPQVEPERETRGGTPGTSTTL
jgi:hypothetical protein